MATIVTIQSTDLITNSRADLNNNFANLNSDKVETSVIDTDTTLAADSDDKIPSQKAVKAYIDGGGTNASETTKGPVEEATDAEVTAGTATGGTGAKLFVTPAKLATYVSNTLATKTITIGTHEPFDGSTTPLPVNLASDGTVLVSDANGVAGTRLGFIGFVKDTTTSGVARYIGGDTQSVGIGNASFSFTAPAGTARYLIVFAHQVSTPLTYPATVSWGAYNLSSIIQKLQSPVQSSMWGIAIGTSATDQTYTLSTTSMVSNTACSVQVLVYENVNQATPTTDSDSVGASAASVTTPSLTNLNASSLYVFGANSAASSVSISGFTQRQGGTRYVSGDVRCTANSTVTAVPGTSNDTLALGAVLVGIPYSTSVHLGPVVTGFSALTPGTLYYVSDTEGVLGTSTGTTTIQVGKALSATEILYKEIYW